MVNPKIRDLYAVTIGIECHVQLKTATKLFSGVSNNARDAKPNTLISHIDLGLPGALPVLNAKAVDLACRAAVALGTTAAKTSQFDRKHYFYPDLPMGYQITQFYQPIIKDGKVEFEINGQKKVVRINEAHLEADAGKSTHPEGSDFSLVDLNRAGTPLLEIVSKPDLHSATEARAYAHELWLIMRYAGVSDADLYQGNMRFDVNVSVSKLNTLGTRTETKNLNSFKSVEKAVDYEVKRQIEILEKGQKIVQETRGWDEAKQKTFSQRGKEEAHDYRYMPDPDIPPLELNNEYLQKINASMPDVSPAKVRHVLNSVGLDKSVVEAIVDEPVAGAFIIKLQKADATDEQTKKIANWLATDVQALVVAGQLSWQKPHLDVANLLALSNMALRNDLSSTGAKKLLIEMVQNGGDPSVLAKKLNLLQVSDELELSKIVDKVLNQNPQAANDIKSGEAKAIGFLIGKVMQASQGQANPAMAQKLIKKHLGQ